MKKYLLSICLSLFVLTAAAAAADSTPFPAPYTGADGTTNWGYLDETGAQRVGYFYASAEPFNEYGFAVVQNTLGQTGVIDQTGSAVIECSDTPRQVEFAQGVIVLRYADKSVYYNQKGELTGEYPGAAGFFESGLLRAKQGDLWGYVNQAGEFVIPAAFRAAGDFSGGRALVQDAEGRYALLLADGTRAALPGAPATLTIGPKSLAVLREGMGYRLYSLESGTYLTGAYEEMQINDDGFVSVQRDKKWGILSADGKDSVAPQYYYLSYMGEGAYAVRGAQAGTAVRAIEGTGALIYQTDTYVGGFETFRFGLSWHGTMDGGVMFFNKNGVLRRKIPGVSNPVVLSENVARVTVGTGTQYIRLSDGKVLYTPTRSYALENGAKVTTKTYEKYIGMRDGKEYGWSLEYPQFSGMKDAAVQTKINTAIEKFFLDGPNLPSQRESLVGTYGFSFCNNVLVVYVDAKQGLGVGSTIWNDSIAFNYGTGAQYTVAGDLFVKKYEDTVIAALPESTPFYMYSYPRMMADSVIYYLNTPQTEDAPAQSQAFRLYFSQIRSAVNLEGECYAALTAAPVAPDQTDLTTPGTSITNVFRDVPAGHWASAYIQQAYTRGLMQGENGRFRPDDTMLVNEAVVVLVRASRLPKGTLPELDDVWYGGEYGGAYEAGLLAGMETLHPERPLTRADAMQLLANTLRRGVRLTPLTESEIAAQLAPFSDASGLPATRREAAAYCIQKKIFSGTGGKLNPNATLTRAEFAKLLTFVQ